MTHTDRLNHASMNLRAAARMYVAANDSTRASTFQGLCQAAEAFTAARQSFRDWLANLPHSHRPPPSQKGPHT